MTVTLEIPESVAAVLQGEGRELSRQALESWAVEAFRSGQIGSPQVMEMLGFQSRIETEAFLGKHKVWPRYGVKELEEDLATLKKLSAS